jgi:hypothetical protein
MKDSLDPYVSFLKALDDEYARHHDGDRLIPAATRTGWDNNAQPRTSSLAAPCEKVGLDPFEWLPAPVAEKVKAELKAPQPRSDWLDDFLERNADLLPNSGPRLLKPPKVAPPAPRAYVHRHELAREMMSQLEQAAQTAATGRTVTIGMCGPPGAGKTTSVAQLLHRPRIESLFQRVLWMSAGNRLSQSRSRSANEHLELLKNLFMPWWSAVKSDKESDGEFRDAVDANHVRGLLDARLRDDLTLQVFDDVFDGSDLERLRLGNRRGVILFTTRFPKVLDDCAANFQIAVRGMTEPESVKLFRSRSPDALKRCESNVRKLLARFGHLPIATIVTAKLCQRMLLRNLSADELAQEIDALTPRRILDTEMPADRRAEGESEFVEDLLRRSYNAVSAPAKKAFRAIGSLLEDDPDSPLFTKTVLTTFENLELKPERGRASLLEELVEYGLIDYITEQPRTCVFHPLQAALAIRINSAES